METITQINQYNIGLIRSKMQAALDEAGKEFGIKISIGKIGYDAFGFRFRGESKLVGTNPETTLKDEWNLKCICYGLKPEHFGKTVSISHVNFTLQGFVRGKSKYPILGKREDGKIFKLPTHLIRAALDQAARSTI